MFDQTLIETENIQDARQILEEYGVCIVKNVLDNDECHELARGMIESFEYITSDMRAPFKFSKPRTWRTLQDLYPIRGMQYQHWGLGHAQYVWDVRCNPKIINAFSTLWETDDLVVSFDGVSFALPPELGAKEIWQEEHTFHTDQSFLKPEFECIQGHVNGMDTNPGDATLVVLVGSHKHHAAYGELNGIRSPKDWWKIKDHSFFEERGCPIHRISCPKGSLVLWDSRTIHYGSAPLEGRKQANYRCLVFVCYTPRYKMTEAMRRKKIHYFENLQMTNHWPHAPEPFAQFPRTYGGYLPYKVIKQLPRPEIDRQYYPLIGYYEGEY